MKKIISTLSELYTHPRNVVDSFLDRRSGVYSHPFIFMACISLFVTAVLMISDLLVLDLPDAVNTGDENETVAQIQLWVEIVSMNVSTIFLPLTSVVLLIPALSVSGLIFFRNDLNGFYDNLILSSYIVAGAGLFSLFWIPVLWLNPEVIADNSMRFTLSVAMLGSPILWLYHKYFQNNTPISIIRQLSTAASGFALFIVLSGFASGVLGYMIFAVRRIAELTGQG